MGNCLSLYNRYAQKIENVCALSFLTLLLLKYGFMYTYVPLPSSYETILSALICIPLICTLAVRQYTGNELIATVSLLLLGTVSYLVSHEMVMFLSLSSIIVLKGQPTEKLLKCYIAVRAIMLILVYTLVAVGTISNYEFAIDKSGLYSITAYTFGHAHPNQLARNFAVFIFAFLCINRNKNSNFSLIIMLLTTAFIFAVTRCRTMIICVLLMLACAFVLKFDCIDRLINKLLKYTYWIIIALFIFVGIICPYLYGSDIEFINNPVAAISDFGNGRIRISSIIADLMQLNMFGADVDFGDITSLPVDCSYTVLLYRFGMVCTAVYLAIYTYACHYFIKNKKTLYVICILTTMLYGLYENILWWPMVNVSLLLCAGAFTPSSGTSKKIIGIPMLIDKFRNFQPKKACEK